MERIPLDYAIWLVGRELQFCSGIRALAAEKIMAEAGAFGRRHSVRAAARS